MMEGSYWSNTMCDSICNQSGHTIPILLRWFKNWMKISYILLSANPQSERPIIEYKYLNTTAKTCFFWYW
jgi:hypothetical protein